MQITALAGGIGGARFLRGLLAELAARAEAGAEPAQVTVIGNTADDITLFGLRVCPDLDTVMYTLGGGIEESQGWGRAGETYAVKEELAAYGMQPQWFGLGDRDLATHVVRTQMMAAGYPLSAVTEALCARWRPGVRLIPMSDDRVETHVVIDDPDQPGQTKAVHFQEWWVRYHAEPPARSIVPIGVDAAQPAPGVLEALAGANLIVLPPSNPVVSIGTILRRARDPGRRGRRGRPRRRGLARDRRGAGARHGRRLPHRDRGGDLGRRGRRPVRRDCSTAGWSTTWTPARWWTACGSGRCRCS